VKPRNFLVKAFVELSGSFCLQPTSVDALDKPELGVLMKFKKNREKTEKSNTDRSN
jgi:hypothetical protein